MKHLLPNLRTLLASCTLGLSALTAQALTVEFQGQADSGPLAGSLLNGTLSYADPVAGYDGSIALDSFSLDFDGHTYTLADADLPALAWFVGGDFVGVDYSDTHSFSTTLTLTAGFTYVAEAFFVYQRANEAAGLGGFYKFIPVEVVPEPGSVALLLAGLGLLGATRRRQV